MTKTTSSNHPDFIVLPVPSARECQSSDMDVLARFMRHLRHVPISRMEIKILSAIQFTADIMDHSDAHIAKVLVELGLRAPRSAFPAEFLTFCDRALMREDWAVGGPSQAMKALKTHWNETGEDKFESTKSVLNREQYSLLETV